MPQIHESMAKILREVSYIEKAGTNVMQGYKFRGIDDVYNALHDIFAENGVFILPEVLKSSREERPTKKGDGVNIWTTLLVKFNFVAADGSSVSAVTQGEAMDSSDKSTNKAMSAALKYLLIPTFLIPTRDLDDADRDTPEISSPVGPSAATTALSERVVDEFKGDAMPRGDYNNADEAIKKASSAIALAKIREMLKFRAWTSEEEEKLFAAIDCRMVEIGG